ncbi:MAG: tagaturonate epimerase family protein [Verrucomicrobiota bacterium]
MLSLEKFSVGVGDRFAQQAEAQLRAFILASENGVEVVPVWNKSNREHLMVGSEPASVEAAAAVAVKKLGWKKPWHVDADHIRLETVDRFIPHSDFYTIDVADSIGKPTPLGAVETFVKRHPELTGRIEIPGIERSLNISREELGRIAGKYLSAVHEVRGIFSHIEQKKGQGAFIAEVSMDETDTPQTPLELLIILAALADDNVPLQTIAPKFTGRFNKGVDYVGEIAKFEEEFNDDIAVIRFAVKNYDLPKNLKLSVHSGSDKFSIYGPIRRALRRHDAGLHLKTAGTTWLEELIGLAEAGGDGLSLAKEIYGEALGHIDELCAPYASVIDISREKLPTSKSVAGWSGEKFAATLRHDQKSRDYNPSVRQLLHVGYKIAAQAGDRYLNRVRNAEATVGRNVTENLFERHLKPLFL